MDVKHDEHTTRAAASIAPLGSSASRRAIPNRTTVLVPQHVYVLCWWIVLAVHSFVAVFVLFMGLCHLSLSVPVVHRSTIALGISIPVKCLSGVCYVLIAILHFRAVVRMISHSVRARSLTLRKLHASPSKRLRRKATTFFGRGYRRLRGLWAMCFGTDGYTGINGRHFAITLVVRESIEVVTQTYQAYIISRLIATAWINQFAVATLVLNCWSTLIARLVGSHRSVAVRRLLHLVADMYLDFVFGVILPVCVMVQYVIWYDWSRGSFPATLLDDDVWMVNAVAESRQVLVTSYVDLFASIFPQMGIYNCLSVVKTLVQTSRPSASTATTALSGPTDDLCTTAVPTTTGDSRATRVVAFLMSLWGVVVLGLHIEAQFARPAATMAATEGCLRFQRPWMTSKLACSVLYLNCYRRNVTGTAAEIDAILSKLYRPPLARIGFAHCPGLQIPPVLAQFDGLYVIDIHNSTLVNWPSAAAITQAKHPTMASISFRSSRLTAFPDVLLRYDLPDALNNVGFYYCNITELPEELGDVWAASAINVFGLEGSMVRRLPASLGRVPWRILWLASNQIDELPENLLVNARLEHFWVSGNPLTRLPEMSGDTLHLAELYAEDTNLTSVPAWVNTWVKASKPLGVRASASFNGSPVCRNDSASYDSRWCPQTMHTSDGVGSYNASAIKFPL